ncbi:uncharacterized protein METZ01_LOCUS115295, partial [marine metagenome]
VQQPETSNVEKATGLKLHGRIFRAAFRHIHTQAMELNCSSCNETILIADEGSTPLASTI